MSLIIDNALMSFMCIIIAHAINFRANKFCPLTFNTWPIWRTECQVDQDQGHKPSVPRREDHQNKNLRQQVLEGGMLRTHR